MDRNSIIEKDTYKVYKHAEDCPYAFICDKQIADSVALLNKKGYLTFASCSGHYKIEFYEWFCDDLSKLEDYKNDSKIIIKEIKNNGFYYWDEIDFTEMYVLFNKRYKFRNLPKDFDIDYNSDNKTSIYHRINYYKNNKRKSRKEVETEIEKYSKMLFNWVNSLEERNDKYE